MILLFLGPPGCGKGTQAKKLHGLKGWPQISTGDMLRAAVQKGTELGREAKSFMDQGALVPDRVVIGLIQDRIRDEDCADGFILDGFPRTAPQASALSDLLKRQGSRIDRAFYFKIPENELVARLTGRRTCEKCGTMFHVSQNPPKRSGVCDRCGAALIQRDDDSESVIRNRLDVYLKQTSPLVEHYKKENVLREVDASQSVDQVGKSILGSL